MLLDALSQLPGIRPKDINNKCLHHQAQVIIPPQKVNPMILEELLYKSHNFNNAEFIAILDPKIAKKSLDELI